MNKIKKFIDFEVKAVEGEERTYWFTASTDDRDRMGDVIVQNGWKLQNFKKNPVILWAHRYGEPPIGKAIEAKVEDDRLRLKIQFVPESIYPFAAMIEKMIAQKYLRTGSVGFSVYKSEELSDEEKKSRPDMQWGKRLYGELLEFSIVPVPANPMALGDKSFEEVMVRSFDQPEQEKESDLLPYKGADGAVNERLLKASVAALAGARGGVPVAKSDFLPCLRHLIRVANENGIELPSINLASATQEELREAFADVWHDELLDVISRAEPEEELGPAEVKEDVSPEAQELVKGIIKDLSAVKARLK